MLEGVSKRFWDWVDERYVVRRVVLFVTLWMSYDAFRWAAAFAIVTKFDGMTTAAVMAAVTLPIVGLQKWIFDAYTSGRSNDAYKKDEIK